MIYKTLSRHTPSYGSLISYITKEGKGKDGRPVPVFTHGFKSIDKEGWMKEFMRNESYRKFQRSSQVYLRHTILSLSPKENPQYATREVLEDLARKYIELRGLDGMYIVGIHEEGTEHLHCHIAESGLKMFTGRAHSMTKTEMHELKIALQTYQKDKYPKLIYSVPEHGKGAEYLKDKEWYLQKRNERTLSKISIQQRVSEIYNNSTNQKDFLEKLRENGLHHYERGNKVQGITDENGLKFRFSRLEIPYDELPIEMTEEERILDEIRTIREERDKAYELEREHFMDMERYIHLNPNSLFE